MQFCGTTFFSFFSLLCDFLWSFFSFLSSILFFFPAASPFFLVSSCLSVLPIAATARAVVFAALVVVAVMLAAVGVSRAASSSLFSCSSAKLFLVLFCVLLSRAVGLPLGLNED